MKKLSVSTDRRIKNKGGPGCIVIYLQTSGLLEASPS